MSNQSTNYRGRQYFKCLGDTRFVKKDRYARTLNPNLHTTEYYALAGGQRMQFHGFHGRYAYEFVLRGGGIP
jgi:hypothetical protein